jgi:hypothetical protein
MAEQKGKRTQPSLDRTGQVQGLFINRYPVVEKIQFDPMKVSTSRDTDVAELLSAIRKPVFEAEYEGQIDKFFLPIEASEFRDMGVTEVRGALRVEPHTHPGTMFGVIVDGDLKINGVELGRHDFYLVPPGQPYGIESVNGYRMVFAYNNSC